MERRLAAILTADVVCYSRLMEVDEQAYFSDGLDKAVFARYLKIGITHRCSARLDGEDHKVGAFESSRRCANCLDGKGRFGVFV